MRSLLKDDGRPDGQGENRKLAPVVSPYARNSKAAFEGAVAGDTAHADVTSNADARSHADATSCADAAGDAGATASPAVSDDGPSLEQKVDATVTAVCKQEHMHAILYKTLIYCRKRRTYTDAEDFIAGSPEYRGIIQMPHTLIGFLVNAGGIVEIPLDEEGKVIGDEAFAGKTADQIDQMIASFALLTTEAGIRVIDILDPRKETQAAISSKPSRTHTYLAVLDYCRTPRSLDDIRHLFEKDDSLVLDECMDRQKLSPDYYVNVLEKSGGLLWKGAWNTTEAGLALLAEAGSKREE